jgi:hypothetical protein
MTTPRKQCCERRRRSAQPVNEDLMREARLKCDAARELALHAQANRIDFSVALSAITEHLARAEQLLQTQ